MNWLNTKYMIRAGVLTMLLLFPSLLSATCKTDTIIRNYKPDSLKLAIKADSIIAFHEGDSAFTIVKADTVLPYIAEPVLRTGYDRRVHRFRKNWERIIPTHSKIRNIILFKILMCFFSWITLLRYRMGLRKTKSVGN